MFQKVIKYLIRTNCDSSPSLHNKPRPRISYKPPVNPENQNRNCKATRKAECCNSFGIIKPTFKF